MLRPDRRRERSPRPRRSWTRSSARRTSSAQIAFAKTTGARAERVASAITVRLRPLVREGRRASQVPACSSEARTRRATAAAYTQVELPTARGEVSREKSARSDATCPPGALFTSGDLTSDRRTGQDDRALPGQLTDDEYADSEARAGRRTRKAWNGLLWPDALTRSARPRAMSGTSTTSLHRRIGNLWDRLGRRHRDQGLRRADEHRRSSSAAC